MRKSSAAHKSKRVSRFSRIDPSGEAALESRPTELVGRFSGRDGSGEPSHRTCRSILQNRSIRGAASGRMLYRACRLAHSGALAKGFKDITHNARSIAGFEEIDATGKRQRPVAELQRLRTNINVSEVQDQGWTIGEYYVPRAASYN